MLNNNTICDQLFNEIQMETPNSLIDSIKFVHSWNSIEDNYT